VSYDLIIFQTACQINCLHCFNHSKVWASKMGRKFDPDAKRWRFRSSLIYALGNGLEVSTYLHPQYFLVLGKIASMPEHHISLFLLTKCL
jgi:hypothetical protein